MRITSATFLQSNTNYKQCPQDKRLEFAYIGRSNVGKSSLINMLLHRKKLAKTSSIPGKTQLINHFLINNSFYIVDLPGYGWAKSSKKNKKIWQKMVENYIVYRKNLVCMFLLFDSRLSPQQIDISFLNWLGKNNIPFTILFTKIDKQTPYKTQITIDRWKKNLTDNWEIFPTYFLCSAKNNLGRTQILSYIENIIQKNKNITLHN